MIPVLTTERLVLRACRMSDFPAYLSFRGSDRAAFVGGPCSEAEAWNLFCALPGQWALRGYGRWMVADRETDAPLGVVGLYHPADWPEPELAWSMFAAGEGRGYAYEAALAARGHAYDVIGWTRLVSLIDGKNLRSAALGRRLGCVEDSVFEHPEFGPLNVWRHPAPGEVAA